MGRPSEIERIRDQLQRAYEGPAWYDSGLRQLLSGVTAHMAAARPLAGLHSIWELVLHATAWKRVVGRWVAGEPAEVTAEEDWPAISDTSEVAWRQACQALETAQEELLGALSQLSDSQLSQMVPGREFSLYFVLHGTIQHDAYHSGQIAILKKVKA